ncbi:phage tail assembly protein [Pseudomonas sp. NA-150]|uniref:phage tail assembly protein n=1 Tax=Pseudomonas sp. NA-150 TaxID=3367525 RepID=UPI0037C9076C
MSNLKAKNELPTWLKLTDESACITLSCPSEVNGVKVDTLTMRSPKVKDVRAAETVSKVDSDQRELTLFSSLLEAGQKDVEELTVKDYNRLQAAYFRLVNDDGV